jgi:ABC-type uncharacterized transport system substrate-binding protein
LLEDTTMTRRTLGLFVPLALALLMSPAATDAQTPAKLPTVGILVPGSPPPPSSPRRPFAQVLHNLGYVDGQTIRLEYRYAEGQRDRLPALAAELVQLKPDVLVTWSTPGALAAKQATTTIPIVIGSAADLVGQGLVASLERPGGNLTGMEFADTELVGKRFELLKTAAPALSRVAVLVNPTNPVYDVLLRDASAQTRALGLQLETVEARAPDEFAAAFALMAARQVEALMIVDDTVFLSHGPQLLELAGRSQLLTVAGERTFAEAGSLITYGRSVPAMFRRAANYVDQVLKGAHPGDLPVERVPEYELIINAKTAKALGVTLPPTLVSQATEVIK